jgi:hypothetical protein
MSRSVDAEQEQEEEQEEEVNQLLAIESSKAQAARDRKEYMQKLRGASGNNLNFKSAASEQTDDKDNNKKRNK